VTLVGPLAAVLIFGSVFVGLTSRHATPGTSAADTPGPPSVTPERAFTIVYRVDDTAGPQARIETDYLAVRRPFDVRIEHRDGPPPGGTILAGTLVTRRSEITLGGSGDGFTRQHAPAITPELVSEPALRAAAAAGFARRLGASSVLGQGCTRYAYRALGTEPLAPPSRQESVEDCVTADDIVLREVIELEGRAVRVAEAVKLDRSASFGVDAFTAAHPSVPAPDTLSDQVTDGPPEGTATALRVFLPPRFRADREASVVRSVGPDAPPVLFYAQRFVSLAEEIVVEQPLITEEGSPWTDRGGVRIDLGNGTPASILYHQGYVEVQTRTEGVPARVMASRKDIAVYVASRLSTTRH
jgi:hypothetical protein